MSKNTNLSFLTDFLTADIVNSRVGMNNASPQATFDVTGTGKFSGILTLGSTVSNGTYTYTLPSATGTLALTSDIPVVTGYVPYTGANQSVDLGYNSLAASFLRVNGAGLTSGSYLGFKHSTNVTTGADGYTSIYTFGTNTIGFKSISGATTRDFSFSMASITPGVPGGRIYTLPDADGTIALTSSLSGYLPLTGGSLSTTNTSETLRINNNGTGYALYVQSNSYFQGDVRFQSASNSILKTVSGLLTAAVAGTDYVIPSALSAYLPLAGGTLTGALNGTSAVFSSSVQGDFLVVGTTAATSGGLRLGTQVAIRARNVANTANIPLIESTASDGVSVSNGALTLASTGAATFSSTISVGSRLALQPSYFGYSSSYKTLLIGGAGTDYTTNAVTLAFNVDITANPGGSFGGNGSEYIWRNAGSFKTPNAANTEYNTLFSWNSSGALTVNQAATFSSSIAVLATGISVIIDDAGKQGYTITNSAAVRTYKIIAGIDGTSNTGFSIRNVTAGRNELLFTDAGAATFSSSVTIEGNGSTIRSGNELRFNRADNAIYTSLSDAGSGSANGFVLNNTNGEGFHFKNGATTIMRMNSAHNVGIGTSSPSERLEILGPNSSGAAVRWRMDGGRKSGYLYSDSAGVAIYDTNLNDAGIYLAQNIQIDFRVGGSQRMLITSGGNVEIKSAGELRVYRSDNARYGTFYTDNLAVHLTSSVDPIRISSADRTEFYNAGTERMRITSGGNVYIGATTGTYSTSGYMLGIRATGGAQTFMSITAPGEALDSQGLVIGVDSSAASFYMRDAKFMNFFTTNLERMRITSDGNVLVGATNADVGGSVKGAAIRQNGSIVGATNISSPAHYQSPITADRMNTMGDGLMYGMWRQGIFQAGIGATNASVMTFFTGNNSSMTEQMRITSGGNVLIGTTTDSGDKLRVNGTLFSNTIMTWNPENDNRSGVPWRFGAKSDTIYTSNKSLRVNVGGIEYWILAREV